MSDETIRTPYVDYDYYSKDYRGTETSKTTFEQNLKWATALIDTIFSIIRRCRERIRYASGSDR